MHKFDELGLIDNEPWEAALATEDIFGDIIGGVGKLATLPITAVAKALPKPIKKAATRAIMGGSPKSAVAANRPSKPGGVAGNASVSNNALMESMLKMMTAKDIVKQATKVPKISAKSTSSKKAADQALVDMVSNAVQKKLAPTMSSINKKLNLAENQRIATYEHDTINNDTAFRRKVLSDLMTLSTALPADDPTRVKIRKVGIMSGLL